MSHNDWCECGHHLDEHWAFKDLEPPNDLLCVHGCKWEYDAEGDLIRPCKCNGYAHDPDREEGE